MKHIITIDYNTVEFLWISSHYDIHLEGLCLLGGKIHRFVTRDNTDYQKMHDECPYCSDQTNNSLLCNCESFKDLSCEIYELTWFEKAKWIFSWKMFELCVGEHWTYVQKTRQNIRSHKILQWLYFRAKGLKIKFPKN